MGADPGETGGPPGSGREPPPRGEGADGTDVRPTAAGAPESGAPARDTAAPPSDARDEVAGPAPAGAPVAVPPTGESPPEVAAPAPEAVPILVPPPAVPPVVEVRDLDWSAIRDAVDAPAVRARLRAIVERTEALLDKAGGPGMLFDGDRTDDSDRAIRVAAADPAAAAAGPLWIVGDLHGDLLALEAALALIGDHASRSGTARPRLILLGDLFDDEGFGLAVLLRVLELVAEAPELVCVLAGNHDEALSYDGVRFGSTVAPSDFSEFLNANLAHEWIERAGKLAVRLFARAPRALFFPDGLLVAHGGFPLRDLHPRLAETGDWNDPACLSDFVWTRAHPTARRKLPNRYARGCQFGHEDFAAFCRLSAGLGRPVTHMARGHDHVEERYATYPAYRAHPILTTVALSRRLPREAFGPFERVPTLALVLERSLPQVHRLHIPADIVRGCYPEPDPASGAGSGTAEEARP